MRRAWGAFFDSGAGFLLAAVLSVFAGLERESGAWVSFSLAGVWGGLGVSNAVSYRRARSGSRETKTNNEAV